MSDRYQHCDLAGKPIDLPANKVLCVGRNYAAHARELGNEIPESPLLFMKPRSSLCRMQGTLCLPKQHGAVHYETELAVLLAKPLKNADASQVLDAIWGFGLGLDLTLRDLQSELKKQGHPWEKAKAFDDACPLSYFVIKEDLPWRLARAEASLNGKPVQHLDPQYMLWALPALLAYMSECFTLEAGDVVLTGTPQGVGEIKSGDEMSFVLKREAQALSSFSLVFA